MENDSIPSARVSEEKSQTSLFVELQLPTPKGLVLIEYPKVPTLSQIIARIATLYPSSDIKNVRAQTAGDTYFLMEDDSLEVLVRHSRLARVRICFDCVARPPSRQEADVATRKLFAVILEDYNKF